MKKKRLVKGILFSCLIVIFQKLKFNIIKYAISNPYLIGNAIDQKIPFISHFVYFYYLWYLLVFFAPLWLYLVNIKFFKRYIWGLVFGDIFISICYFVYPSTITRATFSISNLSEKLVDYIYKIDYPVRNCFPSGHCYFAFLFIFATIGLKEVKLGYRICLWIISLLIVASTVLIKQHVLIDVIGALVLILMIIPIILLIEKKGSK